MFVLVGWRLIVQWVMLEERCVGFGYLKNSGSLVDVRVICVVGVVGVVMLLLLLTLLIGSVSWRWRSVSFHTKMKIRLIFLNKKSILYF